MQPQSRWAWSRHGFIHCQMVDVNSSPSTPEPEPETAAAHPAAEPPMQPHSDPATVGDIIQMALSDHVSFAQIREAHGLRPDQVKAFMRKHLAPGSYRAWRKRVRQFSDRRATYK